VKSGHSSLLTLPSQSLSFDDDDRQLMTISGGHKPDFATAAGKSSVNQQSSNDDDHGGMRGDGGSSPCTASKHQRIARSIKVVTQRNPFGAFVSDPDFLARAGLQQHPGSKTSTDGSETHTDDHLENQQEMAVIKPLRDSVLAIISRCRELRKYCTLELITKHVVLELRIVSDHCYMVVALEPYICNTISKFSCR
jgi:hypothetical protein